MKALWYVAALYLCISTAYADLTARIDLTSFQGRTLDQVDLCLKLRSPGDGKTSSGAEIRMLGAALVYFGSSNGRAILGHVAERFVYCMNDELVDVVYEYFPLGESELNAEFEAKYEIQLTPELKQKLLGKFYVDRSVDPTREYAISQFFENRTVHELWFDSDRATLYEMLMENAERYNTQRERIQRGEALPEYKLLSQNCAKPVIEDLKKIDPDYLGNLPKLTPRRLFLAARKKHVDQWITYPSQREFRIQKMKDAGKSTTREKFVHLSRASKAPANKWMLIYPEGWVRPLAGVANTGAAVGELGRGLVTWNGKRLKRGVGDLIASVLEIFTIRTRYPNADPWTKDEQEFFAGLDEQPALADYLNEKFSGER